MCGYCLFSSSAYWVCETEVKVVHTKVQQLLLLQRATDVPDNLLYGKYTQTCDIKLDLKHEQWFFTFTDSHIDIWQKWHSGQINAVF